MNNSLRFLFVLSFLLVLAAPRARANDNSQPLSSFGVSLETLVLYDMSNYVWQDATDDGTYRYDNYSMGSGYTLLVTTVLDQPDVATVTGTGYLGAVDGHLDIGSYYDNYVYSNSEGVVETRTYTVNLDLGEIYWIHRITTDASMGNGASYWDDSNGEYGESHDSYGGEQIYTPWTGEYSYDLFGATFSYQGGESWWRSAWEEANSELLWSDESSGSTDFFSSPNGGWLEVRLSSIMDSADDRISVVGWDPYAGNFAGEYVGSFNGLGDIVWDARTGPSFAPGQIWAKTNSEENYTVLVWQGGDISAYGVVTDTYLQGDLTIVITGKPGEFEQGVEAQVSIGGVGPVGGVTQDGISGGNFTASGWDIVAHTPDEEYDTPFFAEATSIWINGTEYQFENGVSDWLDNRIDTYANPSSGSLSISGTNYDSNNGYVVVTYNETYAEGSFSSGGFTVDGLDIQTTPPPPTVWGPEAFWVRGKFYQRSEPESNTFLSDSLSLVLESADGGETISITGADDAGSFTGTFVNGQTGVFVIHDNNDPPAQTVVVIPANADGSLRLSAEELPEGMPPAMMIVDRVWVFLGTAPDDTAPTYTAAYYGKHADLTTSDPSPWLVKIRVGSDSVAAVTYTDYAAATNPHRTGQYSKVTHLFQTGTTSSLPGSIYSAHGPSQNYQEWNLPVPSGGLPLTFVVNGEIWRYQGLNSNSLPTYQGYYYGQQMVIEDEVDGVREVTVTDPVHGDTQGALNDVRGSVRLRDGRMAYSGEFNGEKVQPVLNPNNLHTIAGDLDLTGNILSFGSLMGDATVAGAMWKFEDDGAVATLKSALSRPQAQWVWSRATDATLVETRKVMELDKDHQLKLTAPGGTDPGVIIRPDGTSSFNGPVRVMPSGDLPMGMFHEGYRPNGSFDTGNP